MIVEDTGPGFSPIEPMPSESPSKRLGLLGISERPTLVWGTLEVELALGQGCTLYNGVPL